MDNISQFRLLATYFNTRYFFPKSKKDWKETGDGYHLRIFKQCTRKQNLQVRHALGDDKTRIKFDEERRHPALRSWWDTLHQFKKENGKVTREMPVNVLAEGFWNRLPAKKR